jgi:hypothetical protein
MRFLYDVLRASVAHLISVLSACGREMAAEKDDSARLCEMALSAVPGEPLPAQSPDDTALERREWSSVRFEDGDFEEWRLAPTASVLAQRDAALRGVCAICLVDGATKVCGGCKSRYYCGPKHQRDDWMAGHSKECKFSRSLITKVSRPTGFIQLSGMTCQKVSCGKPAVRYCDRCRVAAYCSRVCQANDIHSVPCDEAIKAIVAAGASAPGKVVDTILQRVGRGDVAPRVAVEVLSRRTGFNVNAPVPWKSSDGDLTRMWHPVCMAISKIHVPIAVELMQQMDVDYAQPASRTDGRTSDEEHASVLHFIAYNATQSCQFTEALACAIDSASLVHFNAPNENGQCTPLAAACLAAVTVVNDKPFKALMRIPLRLCESRGLRLDATANRCYGDTALAVLERCARSSDSSTLTKDRCEAARSGWYPLFASARESRAAEIRRVLDTCFVVNTDFATATVLAYAFAPFGWAV